MATVHVRFFARYAELTGSDTAAVLVAPGATVADVVAQVRNTVPGAGALPSRPLAALNRTHALPSDPVRDGDELALLPPLAGG